jgi:hypothetical protein
MSGNREQRIQELSDLAQNNPDQLIRIFDQGQARDVEMTPETTPGTTSPTRPAIDQLIAALRGFAATAAQNPSPPVATASVRKESIKVAPYEGEPELLHRFLADLSSKITLER